MIAPPRRAPSRRSRSQPLLAFAMASAFTMSWASVPGAPMARAADAALVEVDVAALDGPGDWKLVLGTADVATVVDPDGRMSLGLTQPASTDRLELTPAAGPNEIVGIPRELLIDIRGDSGWRPVYIQVRDATGELFHYRLGHVVEADWRTYRIDLRTPPAATIWGDRDGVMDLPVTVFKIVADPVDPAGAQPVSLGFDRLRVLMEPWTALRSTPDRFVPSVGERASVTLTPSRAAAYVVRLEDEAGRTRTWSGDSTAGVRIVRTWDGRDDAGALMVGSVQARVTLGSGDDRVVADIPFFAGLLAQRPVDPRSIVNLNTFLNEPDPERRDFVEWQGRRLEEARVSLIRETFVWDRLEPRQGWFEWSKFDQSVEIAYAHGVGVLGVLAFSAGWASSAPLDLPNKERTLHPPANLDDWAAYVRAVVRRYGNRIDNWEIWNEPNHIPFWRPNINAEAYAEMLRVSAEVIRAEDPGATIVLGGIVGTDVRYLDRLRAAGAWDDFDVLALHGYVKLSPEASGLGGWMDRAMAYVERHGVKPVWLTEVCWPVAPAAPGIPEVTHATQASYLGRTFIRAAKAGLAKVFWYDLVDHPIGGSRYDYCGLFDQAWKPRPAYAALKTIGATFEGAVTIGPADPAAAQRQRVDLASGTWSGVRYYSATGTVARSTAGVKATYTLPGSSSAFRMATSLVLPGRPTSMIAGITGDGSADSVMVGFRDATGERCSMTLGPLRSGTRQLRVAFDGTAANWSCGGGDADGRLDAPVALRDLTVYRNGIGGTTGTFTLTELSVGFGPAVDGLMVAKGRSLVTLVNHPPLGVMVDLPLIGARATELVAGTRKALTVTSSTVRLGVGPINRAIEQPVTLTSSSITANTYTWLRWIASDATTARYQILRGDGTTARSFDARVFPAGRHSFSWNGRLPNASGVLVAATPGRYLMRVLVRGPDGRYASLVAPVDVR